MEKLLKKNPGLINLESRTIYAVLKTTKNPDENRNNRGYLCCHRGIDVPRFSTVFEKRINGMTFAICLKRGIFQKKPR
jgi:hypothetical protein